jgi:hypothetical protein
LGFWKRWTSAPSPEEDEAEAQRQLVEHELLVQRLSPQRASAAAVVEIQPASGSPLLRESPPPSPKAATGSWDYPMPSQRVYIAERAQAFLPSGAVIRQVFGVQRAFPIPISFINAIVTPLMGWRVVAVSDDAVYVLEASFWFKWRPKRLLRTLPRTTYFGMMGGPWTKIQLGPETAYVNWRFFKDVRAANIKALRDPFS